MRQSKYNQNTQQIVVIKIQSINFRQPSPRITLSRPCEAGAAGAEPYYSSVDVLDMPTERRVRGGIDNVLNNQAQAAESD